MKKRLLGLLLCVVLLAGLLPAAVFAADDAELSVGFFLHKPGDQALSGQLGGLELYSGKRQRTGEAGFGRLPQGRHSRHLPDGY